MKELLRWQVGDVRITRVQELEAPDIRFVIPKRRSRTSRRSDGSGRSDRRADTRSRRCTR
jgi:hypothetical protein